MRLTLLPCLSDPVLIGLRRNSPGGPHDATDGGVAAGNEVAAIGPGPLDTVLEALIFNQVEEDRKEIHIVTGARRNDIGAVHDDGEGLSAAAGAMVENMYRHLGLGIQPFVFGSIGTGASLTGNHAARYIRVTV